MNSVLRDIKNAGTEVVFHSLTGSDTVNFRRQFHAAGMSKDITIWTVDDEEVVTSGLGPEVSAGTYVSFDYFMTISQPNNKVFLEKFRAKYGQDALMNTVGVGMYNAAHMAALAIAKAGSTKTDDMRAALKGLTFDGAPQGPVTMRAEDHQAVVPSYLMKVRAGWTGVSDMFEEVQSLPAVQPKPAACATPCRSEDGSLLASILGIAADAVLITLILALAASGLAVIFGLIGVINLGHGAMLTLGAYFTWWATAHGVPFVPAVLLAATGVALVGLVLEHLLIRHFYAEPFETLLLTWGFSWSRRRSSSSSSAPISATWRTRCRTRSASWGSSFRPIARSWPGSRS